MMADINIGPESGGVPGGASSAVRIPVLPTVSTPLRDAPPISRWRGAGIPETVPVQTQDIFQGIENAGEKLGQIFAAQGHNQRALQADKMQSDFDTVDRAAQAHAAGNGSYIGTDNDNMVSLYGQQTEAMKQQMLSDPDNKGVLADPIFGPQIRQRLNETQTKGLGTMTAHMAGVALTEQEKQFKTQTQASAVTAGGDYRIGPDGNAVDGPVALQQQQQAQNLAHQMYPHLPGEEAARMTAWERAKDLSRYQQMSVKDPSQAAAQLLNPNFLANHPTLTATDWNGLRSNLATQETFGKRQLDAQQAQLQAQNEQKINELQAEGKPYTGLLEQLRSTLGVSPEFYQTKTGHAYRENMPSQGGLVDSFQQELKTATPDSIDGIMERMRFAEAAGTLNSKDAGALDKVGTDAKTALKQDFNARKATAYSNLYDEHYPAKSKLDGMTDMTAVTIPKEQFNAFWEGAVLRNKGDINAATKETQDWFKQQTKVAPVGGGTGAVNRLLNK